MSATIDVRLLGPLEVRVSGEPVQFEGTRQRALFTARLAFRTNATNASDLAAATASSGAADPGYLADRANWLRNNGASPSARSLLANRPPLAIPRRSH